MSQLLVQLSHISKSFGLQYLFTDVTLSISRGEHFALIGENGSGKTTLLQMLAGLVAPDQGSIQRDSRLTIGYLPQEIPLLESDQTAREFLLEGRLTALEREMSALENRLDEPAALALWGQLHEEYEQRGGYQRIRLEEALHGLGVDVNLDVLLSTLSSGQLMRLALVKALVAAPDLLLLDEPTNHLDLSMINWLQAALARREDATIIVSHDRKFLNATCNRLVEIRRGALSVYGGNYDFYLAEQERLLARQIKAFEEQEAERKHLREKIKAISFSKASSPPPSDRNIMAYDRRGEQHQKSLQRTLADLKARLEEIEENPLPNPHPKNITGLRFTPVPLSSAVAIEFDDVTISMGGKELFSHFSKILHRGARVILTGPNGSGKTSLLRCTLGEIPCVAGSIRKAPSVKIGYLDQEVEHLPMEKTPLEYFVQEFSLSETDLRRELHKAALSGIDLLHRPFEQLSVGQRKRLMLMALILSKPNVLLLDEPTNHLDLLTLEALEKALLGFEGAVLAVSHDAMFIEKIGTEVWKL